eukprot:7130344-Prymnesium_polylepis.1
MHGHSAAPSHPWHRCCFLHLRCPRVAARATPPGIIRHAARSYEVVTDALASAARTIGVHRL